jgi:hypothetical protein
MIRLEYTPNPPPQTLTEQSAKDLALYLQNELTQISSFIGELSLIDSNSIANSWGEFDGTGATPTLTYGQNIASISKASTGRYTVVFTVAMSTVEYVVTGTGKATNDIFSVRNKTTAGFGITINSNLAAIDSDAINFIVVGGQ